MKKVFLLVLLLLCLFLVSCGNKDKEKSLDEVKKAFDETVALYGTSNTAQFKFTLQNDDTTTITVKYTLLDNKVKEMSAITVNNNGEVSLFIKDGKAYMARYNSDKTVSDLSDADARTIASDYNFTGFMKRVLEIYSNSFFKASSIESGKDDVYVIVCNLDALEVDDSLDTDALMQQQADIERMQELTSVKLELTLDGNRVTKLVGTYVNKDNKTSVITIELLSLDAPTIEVSDPSSYKAQ